MNALWDRLNPFDVIVSCLSEFRAGLLLFQGNVWKTLPRTHPLADEKRRTLEHRIKQNTRSTSSGDMPAITLNAYNAFCVPGHSIACIFVFFCVVCACHAPNRAEYTQTIHSVIHLLPLDVHRYEIQRKQFWTGIQEVLTVVPRFFNMIHTHTI